MAFLARYQKKTCSRYTCTVRLNLRRVELSAAAGERLGTCAAIYEYKDITAIVPHSAGQFHISANNTRNTRKDICSKQLVNYLLRKYQCTPNTTLPAWYDGEVLLFTHNFQKGSAFHSQFKPVLIEHSSPKACGVQAKNGKVYFTAIAAKGLGKRVVIYEYGNVTIVKSDDNGLLCLEPQQGKAGAVIHSEDFYNYIEKTNQTISAWFENGALCFGPDDRTSFRKEENPFIPLCFHPAQKREVALTKQGYLIFSAQLSKGLPPCIAIYEYQEILAVVRNKENGFPVRRQKSPCRASICSAELRRYLIQKFNCEEAMHFYSLKYGETIYFSNQPISYRSLPLLSNFTQLEINNKNRSPYIVSICQNKLQISKQAALSLGERVSVFQHKNIFVLVTDQNGTFQVAAKNTAFISSKQFVQTIENQFGCKRTKRFYVLPAEKALFFSNVPLIKKNLPPLSAFTKLNFLGDNK